MEARGFRAEIDAAGNAIGTIGSGARRSCSSGISTRSPVSIPVRIENGELWGRGAVDAKGPLCTFVAAAAAAAPDLSATVTVVGAVGEERLGSPGARAVAAWDAPDFCVIGEPSGWDAVCLGYRGTLGFHYRLRQPSRHTAGPGESAGEQAIAFWNALVAELDAMNAASGASTGFTTIAPALREMRSGGNGLEDEAVMSIGLRLRPESIRIACKDACGSSPDRRRLRSTACNRASARRSRRRWCRRSCAPSVPRAVRPASH